MQTEFPQKPDEINGVIQKRDETIGALRIIINVPNLDEPAKGVVETANTQKKGWDKIYREQEVWIDIASKNPQARQTVGDMMDLEFEVKELAEKRYQAKLRSENELQYVPKEKEGFGE